MRDITLKNFRCYEEKAMTFRRGINLLVGDNSVGKTSLLNACNYVLSSFFSGYSKPYTRWISPNKEDFRTYSSERGTSAVVNEIDIAYHLGESDLHPVKLAYGGCQPFDYDAELKIEKRSAKNSRPLLSGLAPLREYGKSLSMNAHIVEKNNIVQINALPVYTFFSTEDIHTTGRKLDKSEFKKEKQFPSFGYYECHDSKGLFDLWVTRLLVLQEVGNDTTEIDNVRHAIIECLGTGGCNIIKDLRFLVTKRQMYFTYSDGRETEFSLLSDGYRRLINIVTDIAIRCALLNKEIYGDRAYKETHGTVIIDEIDEHLHPALQVRILKALHQTFPKIQFIVSTHAPLVMSSVESNEENVVYKLEYDNGTYGHSELNTYGLDASTIMEIAMGQSVRDLEVDAMLKNIFRLIDEEKLPEARSALEKLQGQLTNNNPGLSRAEALLSFMED